MLDVSDERARPGIAALEAVLAERGEDTLACEVDPLKPVLNFAFRYQAGYRVAVPISQFRPEETKLRTFFRVTPSSAGAPFYFRQYLDLPAQPRSKKVEAQTGGGFVIGEGSYTVDWILVDPVGRFCRKSWKIRLRLKRGDREIRQFVKPGTAGPLVLEGWQRAAREGKRSFRIAVFLHAAPLFPRSVRLNSFDQGLLVTTLISMFEGTPFRESSVHAVSLQKQQEVFRAAALDRRSFRRLLRVMDNLELGTIDLEQLSNPEGHVDLLADLVNAELASGNPPDAIVFIGPNTRFGAGFPRDKIETAPGTELLFVYLHLDYFSRWFPFADTIEKLTKSQRGEVFKIQNPRQLASALRKMEELIEQRKEAHSD